MYAYISAFGKTKNSFNEFNHLNFYDIIFTIVFSFDIILRFFIAYEDVNKKQILKFKEIAMNYLKHEFIFDILTVLPLIRIIESNHNPTPNSEYTQQQIEFENIELHLIYLIKVIRIKKAYYLLDTSKFKMLVFKYYEQ